jgi:hypothetical protein
MTIIHLLSLIPVYHSTQTETRTSTAIQKDDEKTTEVAFAEKNLEEETFLATAKSFYP